MKPLSSGDAPVTRRRFLARAGGGILGATLAVPRPPAAEPPSKDAPPPAGPPVEEIRRGGMAYRRLGRTDLRASLLSLGSHTSAADRVPVGPGKTVLSEAGQARRDRLVARAIDLGINLIDVYDSEGQWEPMARLVEGKRDRVLISLAHECTPKEIDRACRLFGHVDLYRFCTDTIDARALETWDVLRRAKEAGKIRAIGLSGHAEPAMIAALAELEGLDFLFFPYNFIHARGDYARFLPEAIRRQVGLIAMKPLASGSIVKLDPRSKMETAPEFETAQLWRGGAKPVPFAVIAELTEALDRLPDETLCMAAMRFVYSRPFLSAAIAGMFEERCLDEDYRALARHEELRGEESAALDAASRGAARLGAAWLPPRYRWLDREWRA